MREEKKYEVLPGVELPDFKTIKEAASDFSISDVGDVELKHEEFLKEYFSEAATLLSEMDFVVGNLETPFSIKKKTYGATRKRTK